MLHRGIDPLQGVSYSDTAHLHHLVIQMTALLWTCVRLRPHRHLAGGVTGARDFGKTVLFQPFELVAAQPGKAGRFDR
jgi:hypothetical protein